MVQHWLPPIPCLSKVLEKEALALCEGVRPHWTFPRPCRFTSAQHSSSVSAEGGGRNLSNITKTRALRVLNTLAEPPSNLRETQ